MKIILGLGLSVAVTVPAAVSFAAAQGDSGPVFDLAVGVEAMAGDTTYQIGGNIVLPDGRSGTILFPSSELEWPLDTWLARIDAGLNFGGSWRINGVVKKNVSDPDDNMIDKDWLTPSNPGQLDVYSESSISSFDAVILDVDVEWTFLERQAWSLYTGVGYQYQNFDYDSNLIRQYSPSGYPGVDFTGDGRVSITYEITYDIPYLLIGSNVKLGENFTLSGSFAYAPWVNAEDVDDHVLRNRVTKADMDGDAFMFDMSAQYNITPSWFLVAGFYYTKIDVDGTMNVAVNGVTVIESEDETSESTQASGYFKVGYAF
jgi:outer membrane protease